MLIIRNVHSYYFTVRYLVRKNVIQSRISYTKTYRSNREHTLQELVATLSDEHRELLVKQLIVEINQKSSKFDSNEFLNYVPKPSSSTVVIAPTLSQLNHLFLYNSIPFIGFGFLDNFIMIVCGDYIDLTFGLTFGITSMAAAALGNVVSGAAGVGSAFYVEMLAAKIGVKQPKLSLNQKDLPQSRWSIHLGRAFGVAFGCIIGMFPLLFLPTKNKF